MHALATRRKRRRPEASSVFTSYVMSINIASFPDKGRITVEVSTQMARKQQRLYMRDQAHGHIFLKKRVA